MKSKPKLLDLFCKAGGCSMGYYQAGFEVTGVDIEPQPHYPFRFIQADALTFDLSGYDVIHASPPCQAYSYATIQHRKNGLEYPDYLPLMRKRLQDWGGYWIIENVPGSPVEHGIVLCGSMFGLRVRRHRFFETSHLLFTPGPCRHTSDFVTVTGGDVYKQRANSAYTGARCGVRSNLRTSYPLTVGKEAMGISWEMSPDELSNAIPPAYTYYVGVSYLELFTHEDIDV